MLSRARVYGNLTPLERAILNFLKTILVGALVSGGQAAFPLLQDGSFAQVQWSAVGHTFFTASVMAVALGVLKYNKSFRDPSIVPPAAPSTSPLAVPLSTVAPVAAAPSPAPVPAPVPAVVDGGAGPSSKG